MKSLHFEQLRLLGLVKKVQFFGPPCIQGDNDRYMSFP